MTTPPPGWVCRWPGEPTNVSHWHRGDDRVSVVRLSQHVMGIELVGHVPDELLDFLHEALSDLLQGSGAAYLFWEDEALQSYDRELRESLVGLLFRERSKWKEMHVLFQSPFIGMTAAAVGLILGRRFHSYRSRDKFMAVVEQVLDHGARL
ncbi:MAG: hypothetical protein AAGF11_32620 [Myxococcota bacterium]